MANIGRKSIEGSREPVLLIRLSHPPTCGDEGFFNFAFENVNLLTFRHNVLLQNLDTGLHNNSWMLLWHLWQLKTLSGAGLTKL